MKLSENTLTTALAFYTLMAMAVAILNVLCASLFFYPQKKTVRLLKNVSYSSSSDEEPKAKIKKKKSSKRKLLLKKAEGKKEPSFSSSKNNESITKIKTKEASKKKQLLLKTAAKGEPISSSFTNVDIFFTNPTQLGMAWAELSNTEIFDLPRFDIPYSLNTSLYSLTEDVSIFSSH